MWCSGVTISKITTQTSQMPERLCGVTPGKRRWFKSDCLPAVILYFCGFFNNGGTLPSRTLLYVSTAPVFKHTNTQNNNVILTIEMNESVLGVSIVTRGNLPSLSQYRVWLSCYVKRDKLRRYWLGKTMTKIV